MAKDKTDIAGNNASFGTITTSRWSIVKDGLGGLAIYNAAGERQAVIEANEYGGVLDIHDKEGTSRPRVKDSP